jgi:predicted DNA-binding transcriptional regulator AlpA
MTKLLTTAQVAELLTVPAETVRYWRYVDTGPKWFKVGPRAVRYREADVLEWLEGQKAKAS